MTFTDTYKAVPTAMKELPHWICWAAVPNPKSHSGINKIPICPATGAAASSTDPSTWTDFSTALKASKHFSGIAFVFTDSPFFGVDLDDMPEDIEDYKKGGTSNRITEFVDALKSYAEYSQSGNGIHIICKGTLPPGRRKHKQYEMYETGRYFVVTGNSCSKYTGITDCTESIKPLHAKYLGESGTKKPPRQAQTPSSLMSVSEIIEKAKTAKNGDKFSRLYAGDISDYGSASEADMAFCNLLAFWTGRSAEKMDAIYRSSGLMREKWDRRQAGSTYGALTIEKAIAECGTTFSGASPPAAVPNPQADDFSVKFSPKPAPNDSKRFKTYTFDDMGNARRFVDLYGYVIRYSYTDHKWMYYNGKKWVIDFDGTSMRYADSAIESMKDELKHYLEHDGEDSEVYKAFQKHVRASRSHKSKESLMKEVQHHVPIMPVQLDRYKMAINTPGGLLNLKTGKTVPHSPVHYVTKITPVEAAEAADAPIWHGFLDQIFLGDKDLVRYIQKAVGYTLTGSTAEECVFFLYGTGRNGKSTFLETIREIMGDYATNIQPETIMMKSGSSSTASSDIARLKGARFVTSVEPNEGVRLNEGLIKQMTGQDIMTARKLYSEEFEFKPEFKLWMATNHKPIIRGTDTGIWRRIHLVPFTAQIPLEKVDKHLREKLRAELPGIFRWALDGCTLWQREGLKMPKAVMDSVREYKREMDVISAFIEDRCELSGATQSSVLYACYAQWAQDNNEYCMSATKFGVEVAKRYEKVKTSKGQIFYNGISIL